MLRRTLPLLALVALLAAIGCKKDSPSSGGGSSNNANPPSSGGGPANAETVADFPSTDANVWVNGSSVKLGDLRGDVVLVEAWHRQ